MLLKKTATDLDATDYEIMSIMQEDARITMRELAQRIALSPPSTAERVRLDKRLAALQAQAAELHEYEEKIHHLADQMIAIDLDDGVKVNYAKFQGVLAKIK